MNWKDSTCPMCDFWVREVREGVADGPHDGASVRVSCSGNCLFLPDHPRVYDTNTCGRFKRSRQVKTKLQIILNVLRS